MREERRVMGGSDTSPRLAPAHTPPTASELCFLIRLLSPAMWGSRDDRGWPQDGPMSCAHTCWLMEVV